LFLCVLGSRFARAFGPLTCVRAHIHRFTRPLFRELFATPFGREAALELFHRHGRNYHPICAKMVGADLGVELK
jgi:hypothetical protein